MAYIVPKVLINQEFSQVPVFSEQPLAALIIGPQYNLYRYSVASEKPFTKVEHPIDATLTNAYQSESDVTYDFPSQASGTVVDESYVKVFFDKAEAEYFPNDLASTSAAIVRLQVPGLSKYYPNRFKASSLVFKTANQVDRSDDFSERDVQPGDIIHLENSTNDDTAIVKVKALHASKTNASLGSVTVDDANEPDQLTDINNAVVAGVDNDDAGVAVANQTTAFNGGWVNGDFIKSETFTATVITGGNLSAVRFDITSTNGLAGTEDRTNVALGSSSPLTDVDEISLYTEGSNVVKLDFTGSTNFVVGNTYSVTVDAAIVDTYVPTAGGTFTGTSDTQYKLTVVRGGPFYDDTNADVCARIAVTSDNVDSSAAANVKAATAFAVGNYGVTATFDSTSSVVGGLIEGDVYYIPAIAAVPSSTNIIETYESLPASLVDGSVTTWSIASMRLVKSYEVGQLIPGNSIDLNWEIDSLAQSITINSGIVTTDPLLLNGADPIDLNVKKASIYVEHRDLVNTNSASIGAINDTADVATILGTVHPDNPLAQGVYDALLNSGGVAVYFGAVATNDLDGYTDILSLAKKSDQYYGLVPLTFDTTIQNAIIAHVDAMSTAANAKWRVAWISTQPTTTGLLYDLNADNENYTATITDDPLAAGTNYTLVTVEGAEFITGDVPVRAGDKVLINFTVDSTGNTVYDEYVVEDVRTDTTLVLESGPASAISVAIKVQIQRVYTKDEQINSLAIRGSDFNNRRVRSVFPATTKDGTIEKPGYLLAAALAGLRSGVVPHQGLTNTVVLGFTDLTDSVLTYTEEQLNTLAEEGYWIVTQDTVGATPYVRHQLTTNADSLNTVEDSVTTNVDSISFGLHRALAPFIGKYNVNEKTINTIRDVIFGELKFRETGTFTVRAGNQLNGFKIVSLAQNATFKDRIDVEIELQVPYPLNFINITLLV